GLLQVQSGPQRRPLPPAPAGRRPRSDGAALPRPRPAEARRADADTLHAVYSALLARLPLSEAHREDLRRRGLTEQAIARGSFAPLPASGSPWPVPPAASRVRRPPWPGSPSGRAWTPATCRPAGRPPATPWRRSPSPPRTPSRWWTTSAPPARRPT